MSIRIALFVLISFSLLSCNQNKTASNPFENLTQTERDSLEKKYFDLSMQYYQPSDLHRIYRDSALMVNPNNAAYRERLSYSYKKTGEHIEAMRILNEAVEQDVANDKTFALQYRAWSLLYFYRDYEGTIADVNQIFEMIPEPKNYLLGCHGESCLLLKAQAQYKLRNYEEAIATFKYLLELEEKGGFTPLYNYLAYFYLGRCFTELENYEMAIKYYTEQLAVYEEFTEAHYQLGKVYLLIGDKEKATFQLEKSLELLNKGYKMGEPYFERFDEVFEYQIEEALYQI
jgi:tetratricopeptide (TPR) repeat protein